MQADTQSDSQPIEIVRDDSGSGAVFVATPATAPQIRTRYLLIAGLLAVALIVAAGFAPESMARMLQWLAVLCTLPILLLWVVMLSKTVRRRGVRLGVTPAGLTVDGRRIYRHETIRDLTLYPLIGSRPLFVAWIEPSRAYGHESELTLVTGTLAPNDAVKAELSAVRGHSVRLVMHRRDGRRGIVLVRGLTLSSGQTLLASLAAELRAHSR